MRPFVLVQLSDSHVGADWGVGDPAARLAAAVASVRSIVPSPDAVLVSGDLVEHGADAEYERARELLEALNAPLHVLPGNHDDRAALRQHFDLPGAGDEPIEYAVDLGPLRLVAVDSTRPGEDRGQLSADRLARLDEALAAAPDAPTLVALHHPPVVTGIRGFDRVGLPPADQRSLGEVVGRHVQVRRIVGGHLHRALAAEIGGRIVFAVPSTFVQARLELGAEEIDLSAEPPAYAVHTVLDGSVVSHVQPVR